MVFNTTFNNISAIIFVEIRGRRGRDRKVVGFTTNYAISTYHH
jgi:hypothetical protein